MSQKTYEMTAMKRFVNRVVGWMTRLNIAPQQNYLLEVRGRKTGKLYTTPVSVVENDGERWLVAPYGAVNWVKNARAAGQVTLKRGGKSRDFEINEVDAETSAAILKQYIKVESIPRPYFDASVDSPVEEFAKEADRHPVFRLTPI